MLARGGVVSKGQALKAQGGKGFTAPRRPPDKLNVNPHLICLVPCAHGSVKVMLEKPQA